MHFGAQVLVSIGFYARSMSGTAMKHAVEFAAGSPFGCRTITEYHESFSRFCMWILWTKSYQTCETNPFQSVGLKKTG